MRKRVLRLLPLLACWFLPWGCLIEEFETTCLSDADCPQGMACRGGLCLLSEGICHDGLDNDGDGLIDCQDSDCQGSAPCQALGDGGLDLAGEGDLAIQEDLAGEGDLAIQEDLAMEDHAPAVLDILADGPLAEPDLAGEDISLVALVAEALCGDGVDNDGDGLTDCHDPDCLSNDLCPCPDGETCCVPLCEGRTCGNDGCGGLCPPGCPDGEACLGGHCLPEMTDCGLGPSGLPGYCRLRAGSFEMGGSTKRRVTLERDFYLKATEVTQAEWVGPENPSQFGQSGRGPVNGSACPVENVTWWEAVAYCNALSEGEGLERCYLFQNCPREENPQSCGDVAFVGLDCEGYRLPTEAEWEYAALAGGSEGLFTGTGCELGPLDGEGWYCANGEGGTHFAADKGPNAWGLYDMHGNVGEWVWDWYAPYPESAQTDPLGPASGDLKVARGGAWDSKIEECLSTSRQDHLAPDEGDNTVGFRTARTAGR